jgi:Leucine-rich repeat (LRR) protein
MDVLGLLMPTKNSSDYKTLFTFGCVSKFTITLVDEILHRVRWLELWGMSLKDVNLRRFSSLCELLVIGIFGTSFTYDGCFQYMTNLTTLRIKGTTEVIRSSDLTRMTRLTTLSIMDGTIQPKGIRYLTNLTSLHIPHNTSVTNNDILPLTNLTHLNIDSNYTIDGHVLTHLTNLRRLSISNIYDHVYGRIDSITQTLRKMTRLTSLDISTNPPFVSNAISCMTWLLELRTNSWMCDDIIRNMTNMTNLDISYNNCITFYGLEKMTNLVKLNLYLNHNITMEQCAQIHSLTTIKGLKPEKYEVEEFVTLTRIVRRPV